LPAVVLKDNQDLKRGLSPDEIKKRHLSSLGVEYEKYLSKMLGESGFESIDVGSKLLTENNVGTGPGARTAAPYNRLAFTVKGQAPLEGVVRMLDSFHRTNLLHQSKNITIQKPQNPCQRVPGGPAGAAGGPRGAGNVARELDVSFTAEAVQVNGAEQRTELFPGTSVHPRVLAEPARRY